MKKLLHFTAIALIAANSFAQTPNWQWAKSAGGRQSDGITTNESGNNIKADSYGNIYITGNFYSDTITFGNIILYNDSTGASDVFIAKYDPEGNVIWAKSFGGSGDDFNMDLSIDFNDNIYLTGSFNSASLNMGNISLTNSGWNYNYSIFIAKYDPAGNVLWAKGVNGLSNFGNGISNDSYGNSYLTGHFYSPTITFDTITLTNSDNSNNSTDLFIVKYDPTGNVILAKSFGVYNNNEVGTHIGADNAGNIYITGNYGSYTVFDSILLNNNGGNATNNNMFLVKCNSSGNVIWAKSVYGGNPVVQSMTVDAIGQVYVVGNFSCYNITLGGVDLINSGNFDYTFDMFIAKYNTAGVLLWAKNYGTANGHDIVWDMCIDVSHNLYITGWFESSNIVFDGINVTNTDNNSGLTQDIVVVKFDTTCTALWAMNNGTLGFEEGHGVCIDPYDNLFVTGFFADSSITFGATILTNINTTGTNTDIFIMKLCNNPSAPPIITSGGTTTFCHGDSVTLTASSGNSYLWNNNATSQSIIVSTSGNYTVMEMDTNGCSASSPAITIIVNPSVSINLSSIDTLCTTAGVITLTGESPTGGVFSGAHVSGSLFDVVAAGVGSHLITYTFTDTNICTDSATGNITVNSLPDVTTNLSGVAITANQNGALYQWVDCNNGNALIAGETNQSYTAIASGSYAVIVTQNGCSDTSLCVNMTTTGIVENSVATTISPNPFTSQTTITFIQEQKNTTIKITDVLGKEVESLDFTGKQLIIDKGEMEAGIYFLNIKTERGTIVQKIILQK